MSTNIVPADTSADPSRSSLQEQLWQVSLDCCQCGRCVTECQHLKNYGDPKHIVDRYDPSQGIYQGMPFECSLCGLCTSVCPGGVDPASLFLEMRRESFDRGEGDYPEHRGLLSYERSGTSKRYSWYGLPEGCDTVFFPGCAMSGTRSGRVREIYQHLKMSIPAVGIVLDCCNKPSHDLGRDDYFQNMFGEMLHYLKKSGVNKVLVACPNCSQMFSDYGDGLETRTVYEYLNEIDPPLTGMASGTVTVHDPCVARFNDSAQTSVRELLHKKGLQVEECTHTKKHTLCCGEGGAVDCLSPGLAKGWTEKRIGEADGRLIITYCAGCSHTLGAHGPTSHLLDLIYEPQAAMAGKCSVAKAPLTYLNRLRLKKYFQRNVAAAVSRERTYNAGEEAGGGSHGKLAVVAFVVAVIILIRVSGAIESLG